MRRSERRSVWAALALTILTGACDQLNRALTQPPGGRLALSVEVSTPYADVGDYVGVAISNESTLELGGLQGYLRFDPSQLRYRGQVRDEGDEQIVLVNATRAEQGELRVATLDGKGITRTGSLVFEVVGRSYAGSLTFTVEEAAVNGMPVSLAHLDVDGGAKANTLLSRDASATRMSVADWLKAPPTAGARHANAQLTPGTARKTLRYGDMNGDGAITLADALYIMNASVGLNDSIPPGVETNGTRVISIADAVAIMNAVALTGQPNLRRMK